MCILAIHRNVMQFHILSNPCEWGWVDEPTHPNCSQQTYHYSRKITWPLHHSWQNIRIYKRPSHLLGQEKYFSCHKCPRLLFLSCNNNMCNFGVPISMWEAYKLGSRLNKLWKGHNSHY